MPTHEGERRGIGAAAKLNTTQPAVSMRIAQLEDLLGVRLLDRDRRIVAPTPKGQVLLVYAERLMRLHAEMIEPALSHRGQSRAGSIGVKLS